MWGAMKNDLFEFISQVQEDAQETLSKVVDINDLRTAEEEEKITEEERVLSDFRNDFSTYSQDVESEQKPEFEKFLKSFSLSSKAEEIEYILEQESGITKHYEALVPAKLTPDLFWARYFFKVNILILSSLGSVLESAYDEEEELTWGEDDDDQEQVDEHAQDEQKRALMSVAPDHKPLDDDAVSSVDSSKPKHAPSVQKVDDIQSSDAEEVALLAASNIAKLQEENANLSNRAVMLEREVERLHNQLINERTLSAKLRTSLTQGEERERNFEQQVKDLQTRLAAAEREVQEWTCAGSSQASPPSSGSSIVDISSEQVQAQAQAQGRSDSSCHVQDHHHIGPSESDLSLASLLSASSLSSGKSTHATSDEPAKGHVNASSALRTLDKKENSGNSGIKISEGGRGGIVEVEEEEEEEEWDTDAWE